jgi:cation diffusion facilitator family transporter
VTQTTSRSDEQLRDLPEERQRQLRKIKRLQWLTIVHVIAAGTVLIIVSGSSQAVKATWIDDLIGVVPPTAYLIAMRYDHRPPNRRFPYGYHRAQSIAFFWAAIALVFLGGYIVVESVIKLVTLEHPTIGTIEVFGHDVWLGWMMLPALAFTGVPQYFLGRAKMPLAEELNDKILHADAAMNRADWLAASAATVGVTGMAFGLFWLDAAAAIFIGAEIVEEGVKHMRGVYLQLLGERPTSVDYQETLELPKRLEEVARRLSWVRDARARLREEGRYIFGEVFVEPRDGEVPVERLDEATRKMYEVDWRIRDLVVVPVRDLDADSELRGRQDTD